MTENVPTIAVLGASGLIGEAVALGLRQAGHAVIPIARRFSRSQRTRFGGTAVECPLVACRSEELSNQLRAADIVVNCIGVLQDGPRGDTRNVHLGFVERLLSEFESRTMPVLIIQISIPGNSEDDGSAFSRTKRAAERTITARKIPYVILRPGFVIARAAYGGSALVRALAALAVAVPASIARTPFATTDIDDIVGTIGAVADKWTAGERSWNVTWDVMSAEPTRFGEVIGAFRQYLSSSSTLFALPSWLMAFGARMGDAVSHLGWASPLRSTALIELRRGVSGDPRPWMAATAIQPTSLHASLRKLPWSVQEKWFARLYLAKALIILVLAGFWIASGLIALTVGFKSATALLVAQHFSSAIAGAITVVGAIADIAIGCAIATKPACRAGLFAGIGVSAFYVVGASLAAPGLWTDPLGPLLKVFPVVGLMLVALATLDDR